MTAVAEQLAHLGQVVREARVEHDRHTAAVRTAEEALATTRAELAVRSSRRVPVTPDSTSMGWVMSRASRAGDQVLGGISIPLRPRSGEREVDHRAEHQRRGQRMTF